MRRSALPSRCRPPWRRLARTDRPTFKRLALVRFSLVRTSRSPTRRVPARRSRTWRRLPQALRDAEEKDGRTGNGLVRALVLTPTSELAQQVLSVAKQLAANGVPFRSTIITGEHKWRTQAKCADKGMELIIATPGRLRAHLEAEDEEGNANPSFSLDALSHLVLDEADLLFEDEDFDDTWACLRERLPSTTSTSFVTATLPEWLVERVRQELPLVQVLRGKQLHTTAVGVRETLIDCSAVNGRAATAIRAFSSRPRPWCASCRRSRRAACWSLATRSSRAAASRTFEARRQARAVQRARLPRRHPGRGTQEDVGRLHGSFRQRLSAWLR